MDTVCGMIVSFLALVSLVLMHYRVRLFLCVKVLRSRFAVGAVPAGVVWESCGTSGIGFVGGGHGYYETDCRKIAWTVNGVYLKESSLLWPIDFIPPVYIPWEFISLESDPVKANFSIVIPGLDGGKRVRISLESVSAKARKAIEISAAGKSSLRNVFENGGRTL